MKNKIAIIACLLLAGLTIAATNQRRHEFVIIKGYVDGRMVQVTPTTQEFQYTGISVLTASCSAGAPQVQAGLPMGETLAQLSEAGFDVTHVTDQGSGMTVTLVK